MLSLDSPSTPPVIKPGVHRPSVPRTLHLTVRRAGGGTERNVERLCAAVPAFERIALEDLMGWPLQWSKLPSALKALRDMKPKVVFCYGATSHVVGLIAFPGKRPALVGNIRCVTDFVGFKGILRRAIHPRFRAWVSNSRAAVPRRVEGIVVYNGIDAPPEDETPLFPDLPKPVFGMLANGHRKKGHRFFLDVWKSLGKPGSLVFAGHLPPDLKAEAEAAGVLCPGYLKAGPLLRSLDLLVVPSTAEGIPTVCLEAMSRGIPVLAAPAGGIPELITHSRTGYVLPREQWVRFLERLDWDETRRLGEEGRTHVRRCFSFEQMRRAFEGIAIDAYHEFR